MKIKNKKGFTIIELVIVVAVIGVLTAVLVPTFINLVGRANEASDQSLVKNLNTALQMEEDLRGSKPETMQDAIEDLKKEGYLLENLISKSGQDLLWQKSANEFVLNEDNSYSGNDFWKITKELPSFANQKYSYYAGFDFDSDSTVNSLKYGFDAGENENIESLKYVGTGDGKTAIIRTNGGTLTIDAETDVVEHYGSAQLVNLTAVDTDSYYEQGPVDQVNIKKGRLVLTDHEKASVGTIFIQATGNIYDDIIIATQSGAELPKFIARDTVELPEGEDTKKVVTIQTNVNKEGKQPEKTETINLYSTKGLSGNDVYEASSGYDVTDLALLVVEASSDDAKQQAAEQISDPEVVEKVSEVKSAYEVRSQSDMVGAKNSKAKYIKVMEDFTADALFLLDFDTTIDGEGHTLTSSANRIFRIAGDNREITIRNFNMIASNYTGSDIRGISVDSGYDTMHIVLENCTLIAHYYALNITGANGSGTRNLKIDVFGSTIQGWAAINDHASSSTITVNNSTLIGNNDFSAGTSNNYSTIVFDGANYEYEGSYSYGNKIVVNNSTLRQISTTTNKQAVFNPQYGNISSEAHFNNCTVEFVGTGKYFTYAYSSSLNVKIFIDGELYYEGR